MLELNLIHAIKKAPVPCGVFVSTIAPTELFTNQINLTQVRNSTR